MLPAEPPRARTFQFKLTNVERATGVRIVGRLFRRSPLPAGQPLKLETDAMIDGLVERLRRR